MWFSKKGFKRLAFALLTGVATAVGANIDPFYFEGVNSNQYDEYWEDLMAFKLWGANSLEMGHALITDTIGAVGTGGHATFRNNDRYIGGPIYISKGISGGTGGDRYFSGPGIIKGDYSCANATGISVSGTFCIEKNQCGTVETTGTHSYEYPRGNRFQLTYNGEYINSINDSKCSNVLSFMPSNLPIPKHNSLNNANAIQLQNISGDNSTSFIHVPPVQNGKNKYDFVINTINFTNKCHLIVLLESPDVYARIFVTGTFKFDSHTNVKVAYVKPGSKFSNGSWGNAQYDIVKDEDYVGNLLFYMENDFDLPAMEPDWGLQGTYMTPKTMRLGANLNLAGQVLANDLKIGDEFKGEFHYIPFEKPIVTLDPLQKYKDGFKEGSGWIHEIVGIDEPVKTNIQFDYCFQIGGSELSGKKLASKEDFMTSGHIFPICGDGGKNTVVIPPGSRYPTNSDRDVWLNVAKDVLLEGEEYVYLKIFNMNGAVLEGNLMEGGFVLKLVDSEQPPTSKDASITVKEDVDYTIQNTSFEYIPDPVSNKAQKGITIRKLPVDGTLKFDGKTLTNGDVQISLEDLESGKLQYRSKENGCGYEKSCSDKFTFNVRDVDDLVSGEYTMTVNVTPVNDAPTASSVIFSIDEEKVAISANGQIEPKDVDDKSFTYEFVKEGSDDYAEVSKLFEFNSDGTLKLKKNEKVDYETKSSYTAHVKVTDAANTTGGTDKKSVTIKVTINVNDMNEPPSLKGTTFTIDENSKTGTFVGNVSATDPDLPSTTNGLLTYSIKENVPFVIDEKSGKITVKSGAVLDYETKPSYTFTVVVVDGGNMSDNANVVVNLRNIREPPEMQTLAKPYYIDEHSPNGVILSDQGGSSFKVTVYDGEETLKLGVSLEDLNKVDGKINAEDLFDVVLVQKEGNEHEWWVVASVKDDAKLDYETLCGQKTCNGGEVSFNVKIKVSDTSYTDVGTKKEEVVLTAVDETKIIVNDINEPPEIDDAHFTLDEEPKPQEGDFVGQMTYREWDLSSKSFGKLTFTILKNNASDVIPFDISPTTGRITVGKGANIDYEGQPEYKFKVEVKDGGGYSDVADVTVEVGNIPEKPNFLELTDPSVDENVNGSIKNGFEIARFEVSDPDGNISSLKTSLSDINTKNKTKAEDLFASSLVKNNNKYYYVITVKDNSKLDYEALYDEHYDSKTKTVKFDVAVTLDSKTNVSTTENIVIVVNDVNEKPTATGDDFSVEEEILLNTVVGTIKASDSDVNSVVFGPSTLTFVIDENSDTKTSVPFNISNSGSLTVSRPLDYETLTIEDKTYKFHVTVTDGGKLSVTVPVTVKVENVPEKPAVEPGDGEVNEHEKNDYVITRVDAKDLDVGSGLTYSISKVSNEVANGWFGINSKGEIIVKNSDNLDYEDLLDKNKSEKLTLTVKVTGSGGASTDVPYVITVLDINETPTAKGFETHISENSPNGFKVGNVNPNDPDEYNPSFSTLSVYIEESNVPFKVDNSGEVTVNNNNVLKLDYETQKTWKFKVTVTDGKLSETVAVTVNLDDGNDPPTLDLGAKAWDIAENSKEGTLVGEAVGKDVDAKDVLTYSMTSESAEATKLFEINPSTGKVTVKNTALLDYETLKEVSYTVTITVEDKGGLTASADKVINVIDVNEKPIVKDTSLTVAENSIAGATVGEVNAYDPDTKNPKFGTLYYEIPEDQKGSDWRSFIVVRDNNNKGVVKVKDGAKLNREKKDTYKFVVNVSDGEYTEPVNVTVSLTDVPEKPTLVVPMMSVVENSPAGTAVDLVWAEDEDCGDKCDGVLNYELVSYKGYEDDVDFFKVDPKTGAVTVKKNGLNYEEKDEYRMTSIVCDGARDNKETLCDTSLLTITILDTNDAPVAKNESFKIDENSKSDTYVGTISASDEDRDLNRAQWDKVFFKLADSTKNSAKWFTIDSVSGEVRVSDDAVLDYEQNSVIYVKVIVRDNGASGGYCTQGGVLNKDGSCSKGVQVGKYFTTLTDTVTMVVNLNPVNEKPEINCAEDDKKCKGPFTVKENSATGFVIHEFVLTDLDKEDIDKLEIELIDSYDSGADSLFDVKSVKAKTPGVYTLQLVVKDGKKLDYETVEEVHNIKIVATDVGGLSDTLSRIIKVVDVNESPIIEKDKFTVKEHKDSATYVGFISNDDIDLDTVYRHNEFVVLGGDTSSFFVDEYGTIYTKRELNYETEKTDDHKFYLDVKLQDANDRSVYVTRKITITLMDVPEPPHIDGAIFSVEENIPDSTKIGQLHAEDPDGGFDIDHYGLLYPSDYVYVTKDGKIYVKDGALFDYETVDSIGVFVYVVDTDGAQSDNVVTIRIKDVNEAPIVDDQTITVPENVKKTTVIGKVDATDPDVKNEKFGKLTFKFAEDYKKFKIDSDGNISTVYNLDYEADSLYKLKVEVSDGENKAIATVTVKVTNVLEYSNVKITEGKTKDSVYLEPDTIYTNQSTIDLKWLEDDDLKTGTSSLKEGKNVIVKTFYDKTKDFPGSDTLIVYVSTAEPFVTVRTNTEEVTADNIFTIVEETDEKDTAYFVNDKMNDILVTVKDSASNYSDSYVVKAKLDPVNVTSSELKTISSVADFKLTMNEKKASTASKTPVNGEKVLVSYEETVNGKDVVVTYETDTKGNIIEQPVMDSKGKVSNVEVITVSSTETIGGKKVVISYKADASTGDILVTNAEGNLMTDIPKSNKDAESVTRTGAGVYTVSYDYVDVNDNMVTVSYVTDEKGKIVKNSDGDTGYSVSYTYKNKFGNSATRSIFVVLDQKGPEVKIISPVKDEVFHVNFIDVVWTVDGVVQDTLTVQSLEKDVNIVTRIYRDKAGNESSASVTVIMKNAKNVDINVETPVTIMVLDSVQKYYETNPPKDGETYAVSIFNPNTDKEEEVLIGGSMGEKDGSGDEPYPGLDGHIGPTLNIDLRLPVVNSVGGLATLDDLVGKNGMINLEGVDAANSEKATVKEFVADHCSADFKKNLGSDISKASLYKSTAYVKIWVYTSTGSFVNEYGFSQELNSPEYADKGGMVKLNFELKPDLDAELRTDDGRLFGTGAYVFKSEVTLKSELLCDLPPIGEKSKTSSKMGYVMKSSDDLLKKFGYKRPSAENRVGAKPSKKSKKDEPKSSSSTSKDKSKSSSSSSKDKS